MTTPFRSFNSPFDIIFIKDKTTGEKKQYAGFTYTKINGIYGYLGININEVVFIYADERGVVMDVKDDYEIIWEHLFIAGQTLSGKPLEILKKTARRLLSDKPTKFVKTFCEKCRLPKCKCNLTGNE